MKNNNKARREAIKSLKSEMKRSEMPEELKGKMAVKVVADDAEGLEEGLEAAEDTVKSIKSGDMKDLIKAAMESKKKSK